MPRGPAERAVIAALHQGKPTSRVVADRGHLLLSPGGSRSRRVHANRIARRSQFPAVDNPLTPPGGPLTGPPGRRLSGPECDVRSVDLRYLARADPAAPGE